MADALGVGQHRDAAPSAHVLHELLAASGDDQVDALLQPEQCLHLRPVVEQLHRIRRQSCPAPARPGPPRPARGSTPAASRPPLSSTALPERSASEAICTSASGRDSKTTARTPSGQLSCVRTSPSSSLRRASTVPSGSARAASCRAPSASVSSFEASSFSRFTSGEARPTAAARSRALASSTRARTPGSTSAAASASSARVRAVGRRAREASPGLDRPLHPLGRSRS